MVDAALPGHVASRRRDGRYEVLLHRSVALIGEQRVEIRSARSTVVLPALGVALGAGAGALIAVEAGDLPFGLLVGLLLFALLAFPTSVMALVTAVMGADVVVDGRKGVGDVAAGVPGDGRGDARVRALREDRTTSRSRSRETRRIAGASSGTSCGSSRSCW